MADYNVTVSLGGIPVPTGWYSVKAYGAVGDGVTNDTTAIQDAFTACTASGGGTVLFPSGRYYVSSTLLFKNTNSIDEYAIYMYGAEILAAPSLNGAVLSIGDAGESVSNVTLLGGCIRTSSGTTDWDSTVGIRLLNAYRCRVKDTTVRGFQKGVWLQAETGRGCVYNEVAIRMAYDCYWGIYMSQAGSGWTNDNQVIGGSVYYSSALDAVDCSGGAAIYMKPDGGASHLMENNTLIGVSMENGSAQVDAHVPDAIYGFVDYSEFIGCRIEGFDGPGGALKYINLVGGEGNFFRGGVGIFKDSMYEPKYASMDGRRRHRMIGEHGAKADGGPVLEIYSRGNTAAQPLLVVSDASTGDSFKVLPVGAALLPAAAPASPIEGQFYYDSAAHKLKVYTGAGWETVTSA